MRVTVNGKHWDLRFATVPKDCDGFCDRPTVKAKRIRVSRSTKRSHGKALKCIIHELIHASDFETLSEERVTQLGEDISRILIRIGWRAPEQWPKEMD